MDARLKRDLRPLAILATMFVLLSGGPYGLEEIVPRAGPGLAILVLTLMVFVWAVPYALVVAEMVSALPIEGGLYQWFRAGLGPFWAFQFALLDWFTWVMDAALYPPLVAAYLVGLLGRPHDRWLAWGIDLVVIWGCTWLNIRGVKAVGGLSVAFALAVLVPTAVLVVLGLGHVSLSTLTPWIPADRSPASALNYALIWALWAYSGYGALASASEEMVRPERSYPRALAAFLPLSLAAYVLPLLVAIGVSSDWRAWGTGQFNQVALALGGPWLLVATALAAQFSSLGLFNGELLVISRVPYAIARDGLLPASLAKLHPRYGTPARVLVLAAIVYSVLTFFFGFVQILVVSTWLSLPTYLVTFACPVFLRWRHPDRRGPFRIPGGWPVLILVAGMPTVIALYALLTVETRDLIIGLGFVAAIPLLYVLSRWSARGRAERAPAGDRPPGSC